MVQPRQQNVSFAQRKGRRWLSFRITEFYCLVARNGRIFNIGACSASVCASNRANRIGNGSDSSRCCSFTASFSAGSSI